MIRRIALSGRLAPSLATLACILATTPTTLYAQDAPPSAQRPAHDPRGGEPGDIVVVAHPPIDFGLLAGTTTLGGDMLVAEARGQIGDTLASLPGVSSSSFAPGASRPVLRGFDGDRVTVMLDGIGSIDASNVSADHAVVLDSLTIDHIDVLHGPAVLLYGGQAIGGAVNAVDKRIPRTVPDRITGTAMIGYASAAREKSAGGAIDLPLAPRLAAHVDASWRKSQDLRTGGYLNAPHLRASLLEDAAGHLAEGEAEEAAELSELALARGRLPGTAARSSTLGAGLAFIDAGGNIGISVQRHDSRYGIPLLPGAGHGHDDGPEEDGGGDGHGSSVAIDLGQTRVDLRAGVNMSGLFDSLQLRGAYGDYRHVELEDGEPGTTFRGKGLEARADLVQAERGGWRGRSGIQVLSRKMAIAGAEAFVPDYRVERLGLFALQSLALSSRVEIEAAARHERARVSSGPAGFDRRFSLVSLAGGISLAPAEGWKIGANMVRGARAPSPEELLSDGMHVATQSYELGDRTFRSEISKGGEAYVRFASARSQLSLTGYVTRFSRFISALPTGDERDGLPVFRYAQLPARFAGFEASARHTFMQWGGGKLSLDAGADFTRARLKGIGPVPRIPPLRLQAGAELEHEGLTLRAEMEWNARQGRVARFEQPVRGFTLVNLSADWHPAGKDGPLSLMISANNLLDVVGRRAASFTRDFAPLPGRDLRVTAKLDF